MIDGTKEKVIFAFSLGFFFAIVLWLLLGGFFLGVGSDGSYIVFLMTIGLFITPLLVILIGVLEGIVSLNIPQAAMNGFLIGVIGYIVMLSSAYLYMSQVGGSFGDILFIEDTSSVLGRIGIIFGVGILSAGMGVLGGVSGRVLKVDIGRVNEEEKEKMRKNLEESLEEMYVTKLEEMVESLEDDEEDSEFRETLAEKLERRKKEEEIKEEKEKEDS